MFTKFQVYISALIITSLALPSLLSAEGAGSANITPGAKSGACEQSLSGAKDWSGSLVILDTNSLMNNVNAPFHFPGAEVIIPMTVVNELDYLKLGIRASRDSTAPQLARAATNLLDRLLESESGAHITPQEREALQRDVDHKQDHIIKLNNGSLLRFSFHGQNLFDASSPDYLDRKKADDQILMVARHYLKALPERDVYLVTHDTNLRVKGQAEGLKVPSKDQLKFLLSDNAKNYSGMVEVEIASEAFSKIYQEGRFTASGLVDKPLYPNQFILLTNKDANNDVVERSEQSGEEISSVPSYLVGRYHQASGEVRLVKEKKGELPIVARNPEQVMALDLLKDPNITLVTMQGKAGTGKTLLALAAALQQTSDVLTNKPRYDKVYFARAGVNVDDEETGFLPGGEEEKIAPLMAPFFDNLEALARIIVGGNHGKTADGYNWRKDQRKQRGRMNRAIYENGGRLPDDYEGATEFNSSFVSLEGISETVNQLKKDTQVSTVAYFRGRSLPRVVIIIDEAQNLTLLQLKTLITRAGEGTKIVLMGDLDQVDRANLRGMANPFFKVVDAFNNKSFAGHITLKQVERSQMVREAIEVFESMGL